MVDKNNDFMEMSPSQKVEAILAQRFDDIIPLKKIKAVFDYTMIKKDVAAAALGIKTADLYEILKGNREVEKDLSDFTRVFAELFNVDEESIQLSSALFVEKGLRKSLAVKEEAIAALKKQNGNDFEPPEEEIKSMIGKLCREKCEHIVTNAKRRRVYIDIMRSKN